MPSLPPTALEPRKSPVQARSAASVDAILQATLQVLLTTGKERLTTTRVAGRAGVSIGTLYQYFPNKSSLLQAALKRHFDEVAAAVDEICRQQRGCTLDSMATALVCAFLRAKMKDPKTSVALYAVSSDVDGITLAQQIGVRTHRAISTMLGTAADAKFHDPGLLATVLQGAMAGVSRRLLESDDPAGKLETLQGELIALSRAYLQASAVPDAKAGRNARPR